MSPRRRKVVPLILFSLPLASSTGFPLEPPSEPLSHVNLQIGTSGPDPNQSGGMIPSTSSPFGMTRWVAQRSWQGVSRTAYGISGSATGTRAEENTDEEEDLIAGFTATRQPAIWMGENAPFSVTPSVGFGDAGSSAQAGEKLVKETVVDFEKRKLKVVKDKRGQKKETTSVGYYSVDLEDGTSKGGQIHVEQTATSRVAHLRFNFTVPSGSASVSPRLLFEVSRPSYLLSASYPPSSSYEQTFTSIPYFPLGSVSFNFTGINRGESPFQFCGSTDERQDHILTPISIADKAKGFKGYFCARFDGEDFTNPSRPKFGVLQNGTLLGFDETLDSHAVGVGEWTARDIPLLSVVAVFPPVRNVQDETRAERVVTLRVGTSFISEEQASKNIDAEVPDKPFGSVLFAQDIKPSTIDKDAYRKPGTFENTAYRVRKEWNDIVERIELVPYLDGKPHEEDERLEVDQGVFWTAAVRTLQYPNEQDEQGRYYSGYDNQVHTLDKDGGSYTGYSIWDTYRAVWGWQILFVPERIGGMVHSMLEDFKQSGWLPMWKNIVETNIMIATHADSLIAEAALKNLTHGWDTQLAFDAVWKDAATAPNNDDKVRYMDREEGVDFEARAGLTSFYNNPGLGFVADDLHSESVSRTLGYAYDDYSASTLARVLKKGRTLEKFLLDRATRAPFDLWNEATGFMEAKNADGSWAGESRGWTEGDKWAYSFDVVHEIPTLIKKRGGKVGFVKSLEDHFNGGHNQHSNEPSHHIPYLYALSGAAFKTQERVREVANENYNNTANGLSGNEDCGQMSAWFLFSALGFYPVNPVSGEYVVGSPLFEKITLSVPDPLTISSPKPSTRKITVIAHGARSKPFVKSLSINGQPVATPLITHSQLMGWVNSDGTRADETTIEFEMSDKVEAWGNDEEVLASLKVAVGDKRRFQTQMTTTPKVNVKKDDGGSACGCQAKTAGSACGCGGSCGCKAKATGLLTDSEKQGCGCAGANEGGKIGGA
ncbi:glycosyl hydrolase family 92-domain-containing protein [Crepidotus variabilis]|uniref:Glycosyl hydrolase family 92-domain-containing protein n=1 Tax=Crepidotus variabilis TaxID=179855 RepID=A0A9P6E6D3_9AGAR|nr:glycosyl hydrolase family 92-domain-containing protein [Crepidotus variabilis]